MVSQWVPALENEIEPSLPLHKDGYEWILAHYIDGKKKMVHLKELFLNADKIYKVELKDAASTAALYRICVSISYALIAMESDSVNEWNNEKENLLSQNKGFDHDRVEEYFKKFDDRFYLIHPTFPFMQDPSLYKYYAEEGILFEENEDRRKSLSKKVSNISNLYPKAPSTNAEDGQKTIWGLPIDNVYDIELNVGERISILMTSLLHHMYSHSATLRGKKLYNNSLDIKDNDAYHKVHFYRCAVHYIPQADNLFQTLIVPMKFADPDELKKDLPIWEEEPNSLGFLKYYGFTVPIEELAQSFDAPRSSVNLTHLSLLFFAEFDKENGTMKEDGGVISQMRRVLINLAYKDKGLSPTEKIPFPRSWNPFVATKLDTDKALKWTSGISSKTSMRHGSIFKIPLFKKIEALERPFALEEYEEYRDLFNPLNYYINVHIFAGDAAKDKIFNNFSMSEPNMTNLTANDQLALEKLNNWFIVADNEKYSGLANILLFHTKKALSHDGHLNISDNAGSQVTELFWNMYVDLYNKHVNPMNIDSVGSDEIKTYLRDQILNMYETTAENVLYVDPLSYLKHKNMLMSKFNQIMKGK